MTRIAKGFNAWPDELDENLQRRSHVSGPYSDTVGLAWVATTTGCGIRAIGHGLIDETVSAARERDHATIGMR